MNRRLLIFFIILFLWNLGFRLFLDLPYVWENVLTTLPPLLGWLFFRREQAEFLNAEIGNVNAILIFFLCVVIQPVLMLVTALTALVDPFAVPVTLLPYDTSLPVMLMNLAAVPALCEGAVFRGYLLTGANNKAQAALLSGLCLGLIQINFSSFPYAFVTGAAFAFVTMYTRSIRAGVFAHFCVNSIQVALNHFAGLLQPITAAVSARPGQAVTQNWLVTNLLIVCLIFLPVAVILTRTFLSHNRQRNLKKDFKDRLD
jgi:membrane protease YdiL (CAAX protease family)